MNSIFINNFDHSSSFFVIETTCQNNISSELYFQISKEYMLPFTILKHESISSRKYVLPLIASIIVVKGLLLLLVLARIITSKKSDPEKRCLKWLVYAGMFWVLEVVLFNVYTLIYGYIFLSTFTKSYLINRITMDLLILLYCFHCGMEALQEEKNDKK